MAKKAYIGVLTDIPIYTEETKTISITANNIADYFTVVNGSTYYFVGSGDTFTSNNGGVNSSTATTTLTAKMDMDAISFNYSYSSEAHFDKFTLVVAGTTVANAVSGATTSKSYSGSLSAGDTISFTYAKDGSQHSNKDKCTFSGMRITATVKTQTGTETKSVARKVKKAYIGVENFTPRELPNGYTQVEYIESSGTQYIDTGFKPNQDTRVMMDAEIAKASSGATYIISLGAYEPSAYYQLRITSANSYLTSDFGANTVNFSELSLPGRYAIDKNKNVCSVGDLSVTNTDSTFQSESNMWLFGGTTTAGGHLYNSGKIYSCKIYDNGVLIRDYVPCKNSSGTIGLYDLVNAVFYQNAGTGTFTAGSTHVSLARKIKKAYTGVGGVARPCWAGVDPVFSNNTWEQIIDACQSGSVPDTWLVGDQKTMTINGIDYAIDIIGKSHDTYANGSGTAPLTFQLHDCYGTAYRMNSSSTNDSGWANTEMRLTTLPAILALMPDEVQTAIKEVSKEHSPGGSYTNIYTVRDKLFLLSEIEVLGTNEESVSGEGSQYDYYKAGNSKVKQMSGSSTNWWTRSARSYNLTSFRYVNSAGNGGYSSANTLNGVSFAFCF